MFLRQAVEELLLGVAWQALLDGAAAGGTGGAGSLARLRIRVRLLTAMDSAHAAAILEPATFCEIVWASRASLCDVVASRVRTALSQWALPCTTSHSSSSSCAS